MNFLQWIGGKSGQFAGTGTSGSAYTSNQAYAGSLNGLLTNGPFGAIAGGLEGAAAAEEQQYQRGIDAWNQQFNQKQFDESVRQYNLNRQDSLNAISNSVKQYEALGINPLAASGMLGSASGGVSGSSVSSGSASGSIAQFNPALVQQSRQNKFMAGENAANRESSKDIAEGNNATAVKVAEINAENQKEMNSANNIAAKERLDAQLEAEKGVRLAQALLYAMQYQNTREDWSHKKWRNKWFQDVGVPSDAPKELGLAFGAGKKFVDVLSGDNSGSDSGNFLVPNAVDIDDAVERWNSAHGENEKITANQFKWNPVVYFRVHKWLRSNPR